MTASDDNRLRRRGLLLAFLTIAWNVAEAAIAISAGIAAKSIALIGFGLDSIVEVLSALVIVWQFRAELRVGVDSSRQRVALKLIGGTFIVLAVYVSFEALRTMFVSDVEAEPSHVGIVLAIVSLVVMPSLAWAKWVTARQLQSLTLRADAIETLLCSLLSAALLVDLLTNLLLGWTWADPLAAMAIALFALKEGIELLRTDGDEVDDAAN